MKSVLLKLLLFFIVLEFFCCVFVQGAPYIAGQQADIRYSVRLNGAPVSALCNITVQNPRSTVIVPFLSMTYDTVSQQHNYTIPSDNTTIIGDYCFDITCFSPSYAYNTTQHDCITVTPAGQEISSGQAIMFIFMLILCVVIFGLMIYGAFSIDGKNPKNEFTEITGINYQKYLKYFLAFMSYFFLLFIIYLGFNVAFAYLYIPFIEKIFLILWQILMLSVYIVIPFYFLYNVIVYVQDRKIMALIDRNLPT